MLAVTLMENFKTRQKMNVKDAAREAGSIVGFSNKLCASTETISLPTKVASPRSSRESTSGTASTMMSG